MKKTTNAHTKNSHTRRKSGNQSRSTTLWGYCRVSTADQSLDRQRLEILDYTNKHNLRAERIIEATVSSRRDTKGRQLDMILEAAEAQTISDVVFSELSRLGRSISEITRLVDQLVQGFGVNLHFIKEGLVLRQGKQDMTTKVMLNTFSLMAEIERDLISERTKAGLAARKAQGVVLGRPRNKSKLDQHEKQIREYIELGIKQKALAKRYECTPATLSIWLKRKRKEWDAEKDT
ncbi:recombinase family protein [Coraliomargarita sp. W4R72]